MWLARSYFSLVVSKTRNGVTRIGVARFFFFVALMSSSETQGSLIVVRGRVEKGEKKGKESRHRVYSFHEPSSSPSQIRVTS